MYNLIRLLRSEQSDLNLHCSYKYLGCMIIHVLYDFLVTVKAAPHECVISTGQP